MAMPQDVAVARGAGVNVDYPIHASAAEFYLLEYLEHNLYPVTEDVRTQGRLLPAAFGTGTREERLAYAAKHTMDKLESRLADDFVKYILMACGGEARYFLAKVDDGVYLSDTRRVDTEGRPILRAAEDKWAGIPKVVCRYLEAMRMADGSHGARHTGWKSWLDLAGKTKSQQIHALRSLIKVFENPVWHVAYNVRHYDGMLFTIDNAEAMPWIEYKYPRMTPRLAEKVGLGYEVPSVSVGGRQWALPAKLAEAYLTGTMTRRAFIDRCWSLQHNNGSLFNKAWHVTYLNAVLAAQQLADVTGDTLRGYGSLAAAWLQPTNYVRQLYSEYLWMRAGETLKVLVYDPDLVKDLGWEQWTKGNLLYHQLPGCSFCWQHYHDTDKNDPCEGGGGCMFAPSEDMEMCNHCGCYWEEDEEGNNATCCDCGYENY